MSGPISRGWLCRVGLGCALVGLVAASAQGPRSGSADSPPVDQPLVPIADTDGVGWTEAEAMVEAAATGARVEIVGYREERREVYANPDGTMTAVEHAQPVRVARGGTWVPVDTTLVAASDGTIAPMATTVATRLSGGGDTAALVTVERAGRSLALDWPTALPAPTLSGNEATYSEVLPGVDLVVTVSETGFSHVLVVKSAEAAANPDVAEVSLGLTTSGLTTQSDGSGGVAVLDSASGGTVFEAPTPVMWDSAATETAATETVVSETPLMTTMAAAEETGTLAEVGVRLGDGTLTLVPDQAMLTDPNTQWPVYIDPVWESTSNSAWAMVASGYPSQSYWKFSGKTTEGVGKCPSSTDSTCSGVGVKRLYYALPTPYSGKTIIGAEFRVTMTHMMASGQTVALFQTGAISSATTWNNQPGLVSHQQSQWPSSTQSSCTATNQNVGFDATASVQAAAASASSTTNFVLAAGNEASESEWKRFCGNAILSVTYNRAPDQPAQASMTSSPGGACASGDTRPFVGTPPTLTMVLTDPDSTSAHVEQLTGEVTVTWTDSVGTTTTRTYTTGALASGSPFRITLPSDIPENVVVSWSSRASDGTAWGPTSATCQFVYDHTQPAAPDIDSAETTSACAADDQWRGSVGVYGTFTFASVSTDTVAYRYGFNTNPSPNTVATPSTPGDSVSVTWPPDHEGPNFVTVAAVDAAGLTSTIATCVFVVLERPAVAAWGLGESTGSTTATDSTGSNPATPGADATFGAPGPGCQGVTTGSCQLDYAVRLAGTTDGYLSTSTPEVVDTSTGFSVTAWVRLTDTATDHIAVSQDGSGEPGFTLGFDATTGRWVFSTPVSDITSLGRWSITSDATATADEWTHLTGVYDPVQKTLALYVNGQAQGVAQRRSEWRSRGTVQIGRALAKSGYTDPWTGDLADVAVFDRMLVASEITELSTLLPVRQGYWPLNQAVDGFSPEYGGGEDLALTGDAYIFASGLDADPLAETALVGQGDLVLDGVDDYAFTQNPIAKTDGSFTVTFRARVAAVPTRTMAAISQAGTHTSGFVVSCGPDGWNVTLPTEDTVGAQTVTVANDQVTPSTDSGGEAIAVVYNSFTNEVRLYVNGQLAASAVGTHTQTWQATGGLYLGQALIDETWQNPFAGVIDDVRIYSGVVDPTTIALLAQPVEQPSI